MIKIYCSNYWQNPQISGDVHYFQKQPSEVLCEKRCSLEVCKYHMKIPVLESVFNKFASLRASNFITKKLQHRCFPVKFAKFLRIPILKNIYQRLLLYFHYNSHHHFPYHHFHYYQKQPFADPLFASAKFCLFSSGIYFSLALFQAFHFLRPAKGLRICLWPDKI